MKSSFKIIALLGMLAFTCKSQNIGDKFPSSLEVIENGIELSDKGEYDNAIKEYLKVNPCDSNYFYALYELAVTYTNAKQYDKVIACCKQGLKMNSSEERGFYDLLATAYDYKEMTDSSMYYYGLGIKKFPAYHKYYFEIAVSLLGRKNDSAGFRYLVKSATLNPVHAGTHLQLALLAARNGHFTEAMLAFQYFFFIENQTKRYVSSLSTFQKMCNNNFEQNDKPIDLGTPSSAIYQELDEIIKSRAAQIDNYETKVKLRYKDIIKQCQIVSEKFKYDEKDQSFYNRFYGGLFSKIWSKNYFVPSMYLMFSGLTDEEAKEQFKKNEKEIEAFLEYFYTLVRDQAKVIRHQVNGKDVEGDRYFYKNGNIEAVGLKNAANKQTGKWYIYHTTGFLKEEGVYDNDQPDGTWTGYYPNGDKKSEVSWVKGKKEGVYKLFYNNGRLKETGTYKNGQLDGEIYLYATTGALKEKSTYKNNVQSGPYVSYNSVGLKSIDAAFDNNKVSGKVIDYFDNGNIQEKRIFKNGQNAGTAVGYYPSGKIEFVGSNKNNKKDSIWTWYFENGNKQKEGEYKDGKTVKKWMYYYPNGQVKSVENYNSDGELDGEFKEYTRKGRLYNDTRFKKNNYVSIVYYDAWQKPVAEVQNRSGDFLLKKYYSNSNPDEEGTYKNNKKEGVFTSYYVNGAKATEATFKNDQYEGTNTRYYCNGKLLEEYYCRENEFDGFYKTYHENGAVESDGYFAHGSHEGPYNVYYKNGVIKERYYYRNDVLVGTGDFFDVKGRLEHRLHYTDVSVSKEEFFDTTGAVYCTALLDKDSAEIKTTYFNNAIKEKYSVKYTKRHGKYVAYHPNGKVKRTAEYAYGKLTGELCNYDTEGILISKQHYADNKREGEEILYTNDGAKESTRTYKNGKLNGTLTWYFENGKPISDKYFVDGNADSTANYYGEDGTLGMSIYYDDDELVAWSYPDKNRKMVGPMEVKNSTAQLVAYYPNGQKSRESEYKAGYMVGKRIAYFTNGKKYSESDYTDNEKSGPDKEYYINGQLRTDQQMVCGELNGPQKNYYNNGQLQSECYYINDVKYGTEKLYDKTGKLIKTYVNINGDSFEKK
ncbi:MAG: hypothetical protein ACXVPQ_06790 [Bacteroidia bacterium]